MWCDQKGGERDQNLIFYGPANCCLFTSLENPWMSGQYLLLSSSSPCVRHSACKLNVNLQLHFPRNWAASQAVWKQWRMWQPKAAGKLQVGRQTCLPLSQAAARLGECVHHRNSLSRYTQILCWLNALPWLLTLITSCSFWSNAGRHSLTVWPW